MSFKHLLIFAVFALFVTLANLSEAAPNPALPIEIPLPTGSVQNNPGSTGNNSVPVAVPVQSSNSTVSSTSTSDSIAPTPTVTANNTSSGLNSTINGANSTVTSSSATSTSSPTKGSTTVPQKANKPAAANTKSTVLVVVATGSSVPDPSSDASINHSTNLVIVLFTLIVGSMMLT